MITSTYVSFFNKAKQDAELLEEGFDEIKWHQAWQSRSITLVHPHAATLDKRLICVSF